MTARSAEEQKERANETLEETGQVGYNERSGTASGQAVSVYGKRHSKRASGKCLRQAVSVYGKRHSKRASGKCLRQAVSVYGKRHSKRASVKDGVTESD